MVFPNSAVKDMILNHCLREDLRNVNGNEMEAFVFYLFDELSANGCIAVSHGVLATDSSWIAKASKVDLDDNFASGAFEMGSGSGFFDYRLNVTVLSCP